MAADDTRVTDAREWLAIAREDLRAGGVDLAADPPLVLDALFHAQQAAEKALKGFLTWHGQAFRKTHDLNEIGLQCVRLDAGLEPLLRRAARLSEYAWRVRYPGVPASLAAEDAREALALAEEVYEAIVSRLPAGARPGGDADR